MGQTFSAKLAQPYVCYKHIPGVLIQPAMIFVTGNPSPGLTPTATITDAFTQLSTYLKAKYKCCPIMSDKWPPTPSKEYIKLAVVESDDLCWEDYIGRVVMGRVTRRRNLTEEQILDVCVNQVGKGRVIVIEGAPGIGKSTLAWELCRKWEEYARMKAYSLVILLKLREKKVHEISDVSSLFYAYDGEDRLSLVKKIKNSQGKGVLFVLDGFDELPKSLQHEGVLVDLLQKSLLPECTVIVTSRPSSLDCLLTISKPVIEKRIQILGFSQESIGAYVANIFSSSRDELEGFKSFISGSQNPAIVSLMYVPLYAAFLVMIYRNTAFKGSLPRTITQLYTQLCLTILNRHLKANTENSSICDIKSIPDGLHGKFIELSKLAYDGFEKEKVIFHSNIGEHFGFLDAVPDLYGGCDVSFNFLHLTLQEFFAAYHISQMSDSGVEQLFRRTGEDKRWNVVWRFVAGLTEFKFLDSCHVKAFLDLDGISKLNSRRLNAFLIQCLFEAQSVKLDFQSTFGHQSMLCSSMCGTSLHYYALGYCIANCTTGESSWEVELSETMMLPLDIHAFTQGLKTGESSAGVIKLLHISVAFQINIIEYLRDCAELPPLHSVTEFFLHGADLTTNEEKIHLFEIISRMPHLQKLSMHYSYFRNAPCNPYTYHADRVTDGLLKLLQYLPHSEVTSLNIRDTGCECFMDQSPLAHEYRTAFQAMINTPSNLKELCIGHSSSSKYYREGNRTMGSVVSSRSSLEKLTLCVRHDSSLLDAFRSKHVTELKIVHVDQQCFHMPGEKWTRFVSDILKIMQHNTALEKLELRLFDNGDTDVLVAVTTALQRNKNLKELRVEVKGGDEKLQRSLQAIDSRVSLGIKGNARPCRPQHNHTYRFLEIICTALFCVIFSFALLYLLHPSHASYRPYIYFYC